MREQKVWGERWQIRRDTASETTFLDLNAGFRCSWHRHITKYNLFVVLRGRIKLIVEEMEKRAVIELRAGETFQTRPGQWHEFQVVEDSMVIEVMYVEYDEGDIERENQGGTTDEKKN